MKPLKKALFYEGGGGYFSFMIIIFTAVNKDNKEGSSLTEGIKGIITKAMDNSITPDLLAECNENVFVRKEKRFPIHRWLAGLYFYTSTFNLLCGFSNWLPNNSHDQGRHNLERGPRLMLPLPPLSRRSREE